MATVGEIRALEADLRWPRQAIADLYRPRRRSGVRVEQQAFRHWRRAGTPCARGCWWRLCSLLVAFQPLSRDKQHARGVCHQQCGCGAYYGGAGVAAVYEATEALATTMAAFAKLRMRIFRRWNKQLRDANLLRLGSGVAEYYSQC